ncbi:hypothetical protein GEV33_011464 [Tenebrio molitor]|uniref:Tyr recombinase domain-containing protein n=1 Tax=Tenebrio molitor TaxID=7067 RepID=A0A8J6L8W4_TENMO|nr:hypothetical protein GEV33_011464 [Tenebrio molitor]
MIANPFRTEFRYEEHVQAVSGKMDGPTPAGILMAFKNLEKIDMVLMYGEQIATNEWEMISRKQRARKRGHAKFAESKERKQQERRQEGRTSEEGMNPFRKSSRTRNSPTRNEEGNKSKEMDNAMKTMIRQIREDTAGIEEENKVLRKELAAVREGKGELKKELVAMREEMRGREEKCQAEEADWMKRMRMIEERMEQRQKKEGKNNIIINGIGGIRGNIERGRGESEGKFLEEGEKKRRRTDEKRYKEKVNKKSRKYKSSSLWEQYSMLKAALNVHENVDIRKYNKLTAFLKRHVGYEAKKSLIFSRDEIDKFLLNAPDDTFLLIKVHIHLTCDELVKMCITDIEDKGDLLLIHIPFTKTHKKRSFTMLSTGFGINPINLYRKYINLRPKKLSTMRLFLCYRSGKCTVQPVGINSFGKMPELIATFLKLENSKMYTGHAFRRSAATLLSDCGADVRTLKRFGGWKSDTVVEGYVEDSLQNKIGIAKKILGNESSSSTSIVNHEITIVEQNKEAGFNVDKEIYFNNTNCTINFTINKN